MMSAIAFIVLSSCCIASDPTEDTESSGYGNYLYFIVQLHRLRSDRGY